MQDMKITKTKSWYRFVIACHHCYTGFYPLPPQAHKILRQRKGIKTEKWLPKSG
jgi:hypothetical protein